MPADWIFAKLHLIHQSNAPIHWASQGREREAVWVSDTYTSSQSEPIDIDSDIKDSRRTSLAEILTFHQQTDNDQITLSGISISCNRTVSSVD